jgi:integrase
MIKRRIKMPRKKNVYKDPSIRFRSDGRYEARIYVGVNPNTKTDDYRSVYGKTEKEVVEKSRKLLKQKSDNLAMNNQRYTVRAWLEQWINCYKISNIKRSTYDKYLILTNQFIIPALGNVLLDKLDRMMLNKFYANIFSNDYAASTVQTVHRLLHAALEQAVTEGIIPYNMSDKAILPKIETDEIIALTDGEVIKLKSVLENNSFDNGILFMLYSGSRVGEMLALNWSDVDLENKVFSISRSLKRVYTRNETGAGNKTELITESTKTKSSNRNLPLTGVLNEIMENQKSYYNIMKSLNDNDNFLKNSFIFTTSNGTPIDARNFNRHIKICCKKAGIRSINSHVFRHTFISLAVKNGIDPRLLKRIVGHSNISTTDAIYTHIGVEDLRASMEKINK